MYCGKCGKQFLDHFEYCMFCGAKVENAVSTTFGEKMSESERVSKKKLNKKLIMIMIPFVILIIAMLYLFFLKPFMFVNEGYFRKTEWGMTMEQVKESENTEKLESDNNEKLIFAVSDNKGLEGMESLVNYSFDENKKLYKASTLVFIGDETEDIRKYLVDLYINMYGGYHESTGWSYEWITEKSIIEISFITDEIVSISYADIQTIYVD